jgi:hypothetical protein
MMMMMMVVVMMMMMMMIIIIISSTTAHNEPLHDCLSLATIPIFLVSSITPSIHRRFGLPTFLPPSLESMILLIISLLPFLCTCPAQRNIAALIVQMISGEIENHSFLKPLSLTSTISSRNFCYTPNDIFVIDGFCTVNVELPPHTKLTVNICFLLMHIRRALTHSYTVYEQ